MNKALVYSLILHIILLILAYFGLPTINPRPPEEIAISFDILEIAKTSNVKKIEPQKENKIEKEEKSDKEVPTVSNKKEEKLQENIIEEKKPEEEKAEQLKPDELIIKEKKKEDKKKEEKDKDEKQKDKKQDNKKTDKQKKDNKDDELDSLLKTLEEPRKKNTDEKVKAKDSQKISSKEQKKSEGNYDESLPLSLSEKDMIGNQIYKSWYFQGGGKDAKDMYVVLVVNIDKDGRVKTIEIQDLNKYNKANNAYKIFVDSAIRAVKKASPFQNLSKERYNAWRELELNFDPRGVIF